MSGVKKFAEKPGSKEGKAKKIAHMPKYKVNHKMQGDMAPHKRKSKKKVSRKRA